MAHCKLFKMSFCIILLFCIAQSVEGIKKYPNLRRYNVDPSSVTVSGVSSGAIMAMQVHFAHSSIIKGVGVFAGVPYLCGYDDLVTVAVCLATPFFLDITKLTNKAKILAAQNEIDPLAYVNGSTVYVWHGKLDTVAQPGYGKKIAEMYRYLGARVKTEFSYLAAHGIPSDSYGGHCWLLSPWTYFVNNCNYSGAFEMLNTLYGGWLQRPVRGYIYTGQIVKFNQTEFWSGNFGGLMDNLGFIYVPTRCQDGRAQCRLHVAFHGCASNHVWIGDAAITKTGLAEVADANNIIIIFPQIAAVQLNTCWDWFGATGTATFPTKRGSQISAVYKMIQRVVGRDSGYSYY